MRRATHSLIAGLLLALAAFGSETRVAALDAVTMNSSTQANASQSSIDTPKLTFDKVEQSTELNGAATPKAVSPAEQPTNNAVQWRQHLSVWKLFDAAQIMLAGALLLYYTQNRRRLQKFRGWRPQWMKYPVLVDKLIGLLIGPLLLITGVAMIARHLM